MATQFNKVSVIGLGYIGLPTAAVIASRKIKVTGVDINQHVVDTINEGNIHIVEPNLDSIVKTTVRDGYLRATTTPEPADAFLISVPTPFKENYQPDLSYIEAVAKAIAPVLEPNNLVILESTSPVGATEQMSAWLTEERPDLTFPQDRGEYSNIRIAHCPERVLPGHVIRELVENDRIVGGMTDSCSKAAVDLYKIFVEGACIATDVRTAEMCKLVENSFRDVNIAFANELSMICDKLNIDVWELIRLANKHPRVNILQPGCGVGGHCIAVDPWFIVSQAPDLAHLIKTARNVNNKKPVAVFDKIVSEAKAKNTKDIAILGITFKPDIDDTRESPAIEVVKMLCEADFNVKVFEPNLATLPSNLTQSGIEMIASLEDVINSKNCVSAVLVAHKEFEVASSDLKAISALDFCGFTNG